MGVNGWLTGRPVKEKTLLVSFDSIEFPPVSTSVAPVLPPLSPAPPTTAPHKGALLSFAGGRRKSSSGGG